MSSLDKYADKGSRGWGGPSRDSSWLSRLFVSPNSTCKGRDRDILRRCSSPHPTHLVHRDLDRIATTTSSVDPRRLRTRVVQPFCIFPSFPGINHDAAGNFSFWESSWVKRTLLGSSLSRPRRFGPLNSTLHPDAYRPWDILHPGKGRWGEVVERPAKKIIPRC
jgi:hypothetical protein